jgi:hypothetical protein
MSFYTGEIVENTRTHRRGRIVRQLSGGGRYMVAWFDNDGQEHGPYPSSDLRLADRGVVGCTNTTAWFDYQKALTAYRGADMKQRQAHKALVEHRDREALLLGAVRECDAALVAARNRVLDITDDDLKRVAAENDPNV